ncbi:MAG: glycosyltransferase family 4 protein [bacterium]
MGKLLIINQFFYPDLAATSQLMTDLVGELRSRKMPVDVVTGNRGYTNPGARYPEEENYCGAHIHRCWSTGFNRGGKSSRLCNYLSFYPGALARCLQVTKPKVVMTMSTPPLIALLGLTVARIKGARFIYWIQDLYPEVAIHLGYLKPEGKMSRLLQKLSTWILQQADQIVVVSEGMNNHLMHAGISSSKVRIIFNWSDDDRIHPLPKTENPFIVQQGLSGKFVVAYSGNMGLAHDFTTILAAMKALSRHQDRLAFLMIGDGARKKPVQHFVQDHGLGNVRFLPYQPQEKLAEVLGAADLHLVSLNPRLEGLVFPSKIYGVLAAGRPLLFIGDPRGEAARLVREGKCGQSVAAGDTDGLVAIIESYLQHPEIAPREGLCGRQYLEQRFSRRQSLEQFGRLLEC